MNILSSSEGEKFLDDLPDEVLEFIFSLVSPYCDLDNCRLVCKRWYRLIKDVIAHTKTDFHKAIRNRTIVFGLQHDYEPVITKRYSHAACYYENLIYIFGGCTSTCTTFNDLWTLDLTTREWIRPLTTGTYPSPKACASMVQYKDRLVLFGGWTHPSPYPLHQALRLFNELHVFNIGCNRWNIIHSPIVPPPLAGHSATVQGNQMVIFGGLQKTDMWRNYNSSNDVWCLDLDSYCWTKQATTDNKPLPRYGQSQIAVDENNMLIIGGCAGPLTIYDDVWLLTRTDTVWIWTKVDVKNKQWLAPHVWCHPACKVGDTVVLLSRAPLNVTNAEPFYSPRCSMGVVMVDEEEYEVIPAEVTARHRASKRPPSPQRDENANGQRGSFISRISYDPEPSTSHDENMPHAEEGDRRASNNFRSSIEINLPRVVVVREEELNFKCYPQILEEDFGFNMAAFRDELARPKVNAIRNRTRQLQQLERMEARYKNVRKEPDESVPKKRANKSSVNSILGKHNTMAMYTLDISQVLATTSVAWLPPLTAMPGSRDTILHSLTVGRGELILFGGIESNHASRMTPPVSTGMCIVSNNLYFIKIPPKMI